MRRLASFALAVVLFALLAAPIAADTVFVPLALRGWPPPSITFVASDQYTWDIWDYRPYTSATVPVLDAGGIAQAPAWSPDRTRLAYVSGNPDANPPERDIYVYDLRTGQHARLTHGPGLNVFPAWSPDGQSIAYSCGQDDGSQICLMAADGSGQRVITSGYHRYTTPTWSPDGSRIACSMAFLLQRRICHMAVDGSDVRCVTDGGEYTNDQDPAWSPDGSTIAFSSARTGVWSIYTVPADGGDLTKLTPDDYHASYPAWSPDGDRIALIRWGYDSADSIIQVIAADGDFVEVVYAPDGRAALSPAWR